MKRELWDKIVADSTLVTYISNSGFRRPILIKSYSPSDLKPGNVVICLYVIGTSFIVDKVNENSVDVIDKETNDKRTISLNSCLLIEDASKIVKIKKKRKQDAE